MNRRLTDRAMPLLRFSIGGHAVVAWFNAVYDPRSLLAQTTRSEDATILLWLIPVFGVSIVLDVLINDILPEKFKWRKALKHRHWLLLGLGACFAFQLLVGALQKVSIPLTVYYHFNILIICLASFLDAKLRSRDAQCEMLCS